MFFLSRHPPPPGGWAWRAATVTPVPADSRGWCWLGCKAWWRPRCTPTWMPLPCSRRAHLSTWNSAATFFIKSPSVLQKAYYLPHLRPLKLIFTFLIGFPIWWLEQASYCPCLTERSMRARPLCWASLSPAQHPARWLESFMRHLWNG